jgi:hypothetical protein
LTVSCCNWFHLRVIVAEGVNKFKHPIQDPLLLVMEPRTRDNMNKGRDIASLVKEMSGYITFLIDSNNRVNKTVLCLRCNGVICISVEFLKSLEVHILLTWSIWTTCTWIPFERKEIFHVFINEDTFLNKYKLQFTYQHQDNMSIYRQTWNIETKDCSLVRDLLYKLCWYKLLTLNSWLPL